MQQPPSRRPAPAQNMLRPPSGASVPPQQSQQPQQQQQEQPLVFTKIADMKPYMKNLNCVFIVLEKGPPSRTKDNSNIYQLLVLAYVATVKCSLGGRPNWLNCCFILGCKRGIRATW